jgi:3beta-hydroxy-delta5-steroid dehydrogenase/steroid delta-isomerase
LLGMLPFFGAGDGRRPGYNVVATGELQKTAETQCITAIDSKRNTFLGSKIKMRYAFKTWVRRRTGRDMEIKTSQTVNGDLGYCLVTGAAGFTGKQLVEALLKKGYRVRALIRSTPLNLAHANLDCCSGDVQNAAQMLQACSGIETVFHTAAFIATLGGSGASESYRSKAYAINVEGAKNIIQACNSNGVKRLIHTSSVDVCFNSEENLHMDENTPYATRFTCLYTETKIQAEQAVLSANSEGGLLTCALRPDGIWGPGGSLMLDTLLEQLEAGRMVARIGGDGALHDHVHVDNLIHAHILAAEALNHGAPVCGKAYFISDGEPARMFDFVRPFFEGMGYQVPKPNIPAAPLGLLMSLWQWMHFKLGLPEPLFSPHELNKLTISHVVNSNAARRDFGYEPIKGIAEGMTESVAYYHELAAKIPAKVAFITGGSGGLGGTTCRYLAERGWQVFAADFDKVALEKMAGVANITPVFIDVTDPASVAAARETVRASVDGLDAIVNFAGILAVGSMVDIEEATLQRVLDVNVMGTFRVNREFFPLVNNRQGRIVNISSETGWQSGAPFNGAYATSKHAIEAYSDSLRRELALLDIPVVKIQPGPFKTDMVSGIEGQFDRAIEGSGYFKDVLQRMKLMAVKAGGEGHDPALLASVIFHVLTVAKPKAAYSVKPDVKRMVLNYLPTRWADALLKKVLLDKS